MEKAFLSELLVTTYKTTGYNKQKFTICALAKVKIWNLVKRLIYNKTFSYYYISAYFGAF